jgi:hypothetical protein
MPRAIIFAVALLVGGAASPAQTPPVVNTIKGALPAAHQRSASLIDVSLVRRQIGDPRNNIAICANLAASRALDAKTMGAGYAAQNRILDMAFVLCRAGPGITD